MIKDSGERREFSTGAVRDMAEGKGRFDLMPLDVIQSLTYEDNSFLYFVQKYQETGLVQYLYSATQCILNDLFDSPYDAWLELSKHFENGMKKYGIDNWKKGIETRSYVDSMVRHFCKHKAGRRDEPHNVACLWNLVCCIWTIKNKPELNSYLTDHRCVETTCYHNRDCVCLAGRKQPATAQDCPLYSED